MGIFKAALYLPRKELPLLESWGRTGTPQNSEEFQLFIFRKDELHSWVSIRVLVETELSSIRHRFNFSVFKLGQLKPTWETQGSLSLSEPTRDPVLQKLILFL